MEKDPNGIAPHAPGAKLDAGKLDIGLFFESFPHAIEEVTKVAMFGEQKYARGSFKHVSNGVQRYRAAGLRHMLAEYKGEANCSDSTLQHKAHMAWNAMAELELHVRATKEAPMLGGVPEAVKKLLSTPQAEASMYGATGEDEDRNIKALQSQGHRHQTFTTHGDNT